MARLATALLSVCILGLSEYGTALAEPLAPIAQRWRFDVGAFLLDTDTSVRVDGASGTRGSDIDFKHDLGFEDQDRLRVDGYWRFARRHKLRLMYFDDSGESDKVISRTLQFGEVTYPVNASLHAGVDTQILELAYEYSLWQTDSFDLAGTLGLHNLRVSSELNAAAAVTGANADLHSSAEGNGPLPVIGMRFIWALNDRFYFDGLAQFFATEMDRYDGSLSDYKLGFVWQPLKNFGVGAGYNRFTARLDVSEEKFSGRLNFKYGGPLLFLSVAF